LSAIYFYVNPVRNLSGALNPDGITLKSYPAAEQRGIISNGVKGVFMARSPITRNGYNQLHKELENAEYEAAKERQSFVEGKIREIEQKLANSEIIDNINLPNGKVGFGSVVTLENLDNGGKVTYQIVGPDESDIPSCKISIASPLGRALLGKEADEEVAVHTPGGIKKYTVLKIA
jgi:transcription elongation factor GreA